MFEVQVGDEIRMSVLIDRRELEGRLVGGCYRLLPGLKILVRQAELIDTDHLVFLINLVDTLVNVAAIVSEEADDV